MTIKEKYDVFFDETNNVYQIRTKNDVIVIEFSDSEKESIFKEILNLYEKQDYYTFLQIKEKLISKYPYEKVFDVIQELQDCCLLTEDNFEASPDECIKITHPDEISPFNFNKQFDNIPEAKLGYIGDKELGEIIKTKAVEYGYEKWDAHYLSDKIEESIIRDIFENNDFIIVDSSIWNPYIMELSNEIALELKRPWLLIEGMVDFINFSIGPLFHGRETGCYECYKNRLRSNDEFILYTQSYEAYLKKNKKSAKPDIVQKLVKDFIACITIMDISKFIAGWYIPETWRTCLMVNIQTFCITKHPFLKAPVCYKCNPLIDYNPYPWLESVTLK